MTRPGILVVEDDDAIATGLVRVLDSQGYDVRRVDRGAGALAAARAGVALVLLDLGLPDIDGVQVCRSLRTSRSSSSPRAMRSWTSSPDSTPARTTTS